MASWCRISGLIRKTKILQASELSGCFGFGCQESIARVLTREAINFPAANAVLSHQFHSTPCYHKKKPKNMPTLNVRVKNADAQRVYIRKKMAIQDLARAMNKSVDDVFGVMKQLEIMRKKYKADTVINDSTIMEIIRKCGMLAEYESGSSIMDKVNKDLKRQPPPNPEDLVSRPPVVTIMGHVDHGKTTLLDRLRNSKIVDQEFGGITQHIGAFMVKLQTGHSLCFLDTPGHAAFSAMRSRGAHLTDVVVLVVAADDGVMQQTRESIQHALDSQVPIVVALNKIDKDNADVEKSKYMLLEQNVMLEEFGGDVQLVPISALKGTNIDQLQEAIITQAELCDLKGDPKSLVEGQVVEARLDPRRGRLVTAVIQRGTLKKGDVLVAGTTLCKVKAMFDEFGKPVLKASPGMPVEIFGFKETPNAGEEILQVSTEKQAKEAVAWRKAVILDKKADEDAIAIKEKRDEHNKEYREFHLNKRALGKYMMRNELDIARKHSKAVEDTHPKVAMILKGDVDGSVEAILNTLETYHSSKCDLDIVHFGVGSVTDSEVEMAKTFGAEIYAFNIDVPLSVADNAKESGVVIHRHNIIYRLFDDLKKSLKSKLPPLLVEVSLGKAKVQEVFYYTLPSKKKACVAGCRVSTGTIYKKQLIKLIRNEEVIYTGKISTLKNFKVEVESIKSGSECGIILDTDDIHCKAHDIIECYEIEEQEDDIQWDLGFETMNAMQNEL